ncbi:MAG TPA: L-seryl-tRNA(Sec) selenium transferase [Anaerolineales bacterium]|nr:L-seryl-tRNA(Sec) selenium transferase [Anaerolineales bacterium]
MMTTLRDLPSIEQLLQTRAAAELIAEYGRPLALDALRAELTDIRARLKSDPESAAPEINGILASADSRLGAWTAPTLLPVINATGVILHTNLGRAPLSAATLRAMDAVARTYSNLEYDLAKGQRGSRFVHVESILQRLTGAEAALVVNNNASAVLLALSALANRKRVVIPRTQLVEIGGGFRVLDVMKQSGAKMVEVGATNRVHLSDFEEAFEEPAALALWAHRSNFKIVGFTDEPELKDVADLAHRKNAIFVADLGSGVLLDTAKYGLAHEPTVQESLAAGADLVCFSGDKLLGGPQAGILVGKADLIARLKKHPLARAVRADKTCLAGLSATLMHYLKDEAEREVPIWRMMSLTQKQVKGRAEAWIQDLGQGEVVEGESTVGGGSLPGESFPTYLLALNVKSPAKFLAQLRMQNPPIIARTEDDRILFDPRTILPEQEGAFLVGLKNVLKS